MRKAALYLSICLMCLSCADKDTFYHYHQRLASDTWKQQDSLIFQDSMMIFPNEKTIQMSVELRHSNNYPYQNLCLIIDTYLQDTSYQDKVTFDLCDTKGFWVGKGWGSLFSVEKEIRIFSSMSGEYPFTIKVYQTMPDDLKGIEDIGIKFSASDWRLNAEK